MKRIFSTLLFLLLPLVAEAQNFGSTVFVSATPVCDTSAYATGDLMGGKLTFSDAFRPDKAAGQLVGVRIKDLAAQAIDLDLVLFSRDPSLTTFTDQAALDIHDTDLGKVVATINLGSSSRFAFADNSVHFIASQYIPLEGKDSNGAPSTTIYGALVARGAFTCATASDVTITLEILQD